MSEEQLRDRVRHFLQKEAEVRSGGDINFNPGLLMGDGRKRVGRPRKVGRPKGGDINYNPGLLVGDGRRKKGGASGNHSALSAWREFFEGYRAQHPNMPYREAQKRAAVIYKQ